MEAMITKDQQGPKLEEVDQIQLLEGILIKT
jgi:hypothetical protein